MNAQKRGDREPGARGASAIPRRPEIDYVKGLAIIFVFLIHAEPLRGSWLHEYVIDRAVPMFLVLFGTTSQLWWRGHPSVGGWVRLGRWYKGRFQRLVPPVWAVLTIWWLLSLWMPHYPKLAPGLILANYLGYAPWIGTFWFVTLIFQLIVLYPALQSALDRFGAPLCLSLAGLAAVWSHLHALEIVGWLRVLLRDTAPQQGFYQFYYFWIFPLQYFWLVMAGALLAGVNAKPVAALLAFAAAFAAGVLLHAAVSPNMPLAANAIQRLADVPLTYAAIAALSWFKEGGFTGRWLGWFGRHSWGLYLAQMLLHDVAGRLGLDPDHLRFAQRLGYLAFLVAASVAIVPAANTLRGAARVYLPAFAPVPALRSRIAARDRGRPKNQP